MWKCEKDLYRRKLRDLGDVLVERFVAVETLSHDENSLTSGHSIFAFKSPCLYRVPEQQIAPRKENRAWRPLPSLCSSAAEPRIYYFVTVSTGACPTFAAIISLSKTLS